MYFDTIFMDRTRGKSMNAKGLGWAAAVLGVAAAILWLSSRSASQDCGGRSDHYLAVIYTTAGEMVEAYVRNQSEEELHTVTITPLGGPTIGPTKKFRSLPAGASRRNERTPVEVALETPLTLGKYESALYSLPPKAAKSSLTIAFWIDGQRKEEVHCGAQTKS
jgi:hypothetical protein